MREGFVDLRHGGGSSEGGGGGNESFWPSFTDIMMVVMMIFMIVSVVLIMRNWELVAELRETMEAEHRAAELARSTRETNATLEEQLAHAQHQLSELRMQLMQAAEADELKGRMLADREERIAALLAEKSAAAERRKQLEQQLQAALEEQTRQRTAFEQQLALNELQLTEAAAQAASQAETIDSLRRELELGGEQLNQLQGEYDTLKQKYDKLVRPARTARGKHVVEVRYEKVGSVYRIQYREPGDEGYRRMQRAELEKRLAELKKRHPKRLYIKIIIPDESGLTYSEAWGFMKELLERYDYYYQE